MQVVKIPAWILRPFVAEVLKRERVPMNISQAIALIEQLLGDYSTLEAGQPVTLPAFDLDVAGGKYKIAITLSKAAA